MQLDSRSRDGRSHARSAAWLVLCTLLPLGSAGAQTFTRITDPANPIAADPGHTQNEYFGASWVDVDGDGWLDLIVNQGIYYHNLTGGNFERLDGTGLGDGQVASSFSMSGNSWGDFDNDGDVDGYIAGERSLIYAQDAGSFSALLTGDVGDGLANRGWTVAWGDYDNDSYLDAVIVHPAGFIPGGPALPNHQYLNDGPPNFTFTRVTTGPIVTGLDSYTVGTWSDYDNDGDLDFFVGSGPANGTTQPDNLYRNLLTETGTADFERITDAPIATDPQDGQVWNWIDYDNDGDLDAYVTNWGGSLGGLANRLYRQDAGGAFTSIATGAIVTDTDVSLPSVWADFDNDGDPDCFVGSDGAGVDRYYRNDGGDTFTSITTTPLDDFPRASRGATAGDYDNDGDMDLYVNGVGIYRRLFRNDTDNGNHWINVKLTGIASNRTGIGAKVRVKATIDGSPVWQMREVSGQNTFNGHNSQRVHVGLGDATVIDSIRVEWPSGTVDVLEDVPVDQFMMIVEGGVVDVDDAISVVPQLQLQASPNPFRPQTTIRYQLQHDAPVSLSVFDLQGRLVREFFTDALQPAGSRDVAWSGTDDRGARVASGVYLARVVVDGVASSMALTVLR